jgi:hypothetical protein
MPVPPIRQQFGNRAGQSVGARQRTAPRLAAQATGVLQLAEVSSRLMQQERPAPQVAPSRQLTLIPWQVIWASMQVAIPPAIGRQQDCMPGMQVI